MEKTIMNDQDYKKTHKQIITLLTKKNINLSESVVIWLNLGLYIFSNFGKGKKSRLGAISEMQKYLIHSLNEEI